jgi:DNA replication and repair protein RecF
MTTYGSQGQQRLATLALKFAAREYLRAETGQDPILLFDDVMSELDERRRGYLTEYFLGSTQAVITTTNLEYFEEKVLDRARVVRISGGSVLQDTRAGVTDRVADPKPLS